SHVRADASKGPPSDAEIDELVKKHWRDVDRPEGLRVIHAVARVPDGAKPSARENARVVAEAIERAVAGAADAEQFEKLAKSAARAGVEVIVETLSFAADGRDLEHDGQFDQEFVAGALALAVVGRTSHPVASDFGWHVIRVLEKLPSKSVPREEL